MKILFSTSHFGFLRNVEAAVRTLATRGHAVHLLADRREQLGGMRTIERLTALPAVTYGWGPSLRHGVWSDCGVSFRLCLDYWRYLQPRYETAPKLRARARGQVPDIVARLSELTVGQLPGTIGPLSAVLRTVERSIPFSPAARSLLEEQAPDVLVVTPLLYFGSRQTDYVRAARALGIPTLLSVGSWDHLTTKGLIHEVPDRVVVWNEAQKKEAVEIHQVPSDRIRVTGAGTYDHWFEQRPSVSRQTFCERLDLPVEAPLLLYLCSSPFITPREVEFVRTWIERIRNGPDDRLRSTLVMTPIPARPRTSTSRQKDTMSRRSTPS